MSVFFTLEASQPCGKTYRVGLGLPSAPAPQSGLGTKLAVKVVLTTRDTLETECPFSIPWQDLPSDDWIV
jgi:hypothetical protein